MTRRTRRRVYVIALAALIGAGSPVWAPPLLRVMPAFRVEQVEVVGTRFLAPGQVAERADVPADASVWDEPDRWRSRVESHPLVERARVRRSGFHTLEITVEEVEPLALVASTGDGGPLRPVSASGRLLPLDPAEHGLDLPILLVDGKGGERAAATSPGGRLEGPDARTMVRVLAELQRENPGFVGKISSLHTLAGGGVRARMVESTHARSVILPPEDPVRALRRVELALGEEGGPVRAADARFRGQVVVDRAGGDR